MKKMSHVISLKYSTEGVRIEVSAQDRILFRAKPATLTAREARMIALALLETADAADDKSHIALINAAVRACEEKT